ncbi:MAG: phosphoribosylanthranilate isomerase [Chitinivibrionales bacterium]
MLCRIKVCGITERENALSLSALRIDALGFIFAKESSRYIEPDKAGGIIDALPPFVKTVGVFVNASCREIEEVKRKAGFDVCQLHGDESPEYIKALKMPVIKSFSSDENLKKGTVMSYASASGILLDASKGSMRGGTGEKCNWEKAHEIGGYGLNTILAGGLSETNVKEAVQKVRPYAVDLNSGVEDSPGIKNIGRVKSVIDLIS